MAETDNNGARRKERCFVVMGFGVKTDLATGRKLNLDVSYQDLIKPVVEARGIECVRADEIRHSGAIDVPMYEQLLAADYVIADLSTMNANALYELGIRHALRPRMTIIISEKELTYPFDLNHVSIARYTHLGDEIGFREVTRFREALGQTLDAVRASQSVDSPIYRFLPALQPPQEKVEQVVAAATQAVAARKSAAWAAGDTSLAVLIKQGEGAIQRGDFVTAKAMFSTALQSGRQGGRAEGAALLHDPYLHQRLVLATYKSELPDEDAALNEALRLIEPLQPEVSNDPETLGLAGAIEKRLFERARDAGHLDRAIGYYRRGFVLKDDWYNGINLAYLLTVRADAAPPEIADVERIADLVVANRTRREVLDRCRRDIVAIRDRRAEAPAGAAPEGQTVRDQAAEFFALVTLAEAAAGLGDEAGYTEARAAAAAIGHADWVLQTLDSQVARLKAILGRRGCLLETPARPGQAA